MRLRQETEQMFHDLFLEAKRKREKGLRARGSPKVRYTTDAFVRDLLLSAPVWMRGNEVSGLA
ncbi:MAG: hypothetical protein ACREB9_00190 [Thermoplasmata archaeon]